MTERQFLKIMDECTALDATGKMTFNLGKMLDSMGVARTHNNQAILSKLLERIIRKHLPNVPIMYTEQNGEARDDGDQQSLAT